MEKDQIQEELVENPSIYTRRSVRKVKEPNKSKKHKVVAYEDDPSYSYEEDEDEIVEHQKKVPGYRCSPHLIPELFKQLDGKQKGWVKNIQFDPLQDMIESRAPKSLTMWLVDRVDITNGTIEVCGIPIDIRDAVVRILKLPFGGTKVPHPLNGRSKAKRTKGDSSRPELKYSENGRGQTYKDALKDLLAEKENEEEFCRSFVMLVLCIYLAPMTSLNINRSYYPALMDVPKIPLMDWCSFIAGYLIQGIEDYRKSKESFVKYVQVAGCLHILPLIYIDALIQNKALRLPEALRMPEGEPRIHHIGTQQLNYLASFDVKSRSKDHVEYGLLQESQSPCDVSRNSKTSIGISKCNPTTNQDQPSFASASVKLKTNEIRHPEELIYAAVLDNMPKDNFVEDGNCVDSETHTDDLVDKFATTDIDQNINKHPVSGELGTAITSCNTTSLVFVEPVELGTSPRSAASGSLTGHIILSSKYSGEQVQSSSPSEPSSAQMMHVAPDAPKGMNSGLTSSMENAGDQSAKKARVDRRSSGQAKRARGVAALDTSLLNCSLCCCPIKPPVFKCNRTHLACGRCIGEFPDEQCQMCEHGGGFSPCPIMDNIVSLAMVECSHVGCKSSVPYHEFDDHESVCPHTPCYCTEPGCSFYGSPHALVGHLAAQHSLPVHKVHYGEKHRLRVSEKRCVLHGLRDDSAFLIAVGAHGADVAVSVVCIRADASLRPRYVVKLSAKGPPPPSSATGSIKLKLKVVTSSTRPGEVVVDELPSFLTVPPKYLAGSGASKEVTLDIRIDKM